MFYIFIIAIILRIILSAYCMDLIELKYISTYQKYLLKIDRFPKAASSKRFKDMKKRYKFYEFIYENIEDIYDYFMIIFAFYNFVNLVIKTF